MNLNVNNTNELLKENIKLKDFIKRLKDNRTSYSLYSRQVIDDKIWAEIQKEFNIS